MKKTKSIILLALVALFAAVPGASAATIDSIVNDAQDGHIDGTYSQAQLRSALASPLLATYGGKGGVEAVRSSIGNHGVAAVNSGALPFTGAEIVTFVALGGLLIGTGLVLRRTNRADS